MKRFFLSVAGLILLTAQCGAVMADDAFSMQTLLDIKRLSDPQLSPDGQKLVFVVRETDIDANKGRTDIWLLPLDDASATPRALTTNKNTDKHPRWSADGKTLYFLSTRSGSTQVWSLSMRGGEAQQVTDLPVGIANLVVSSTGDHLAFTANVFTGCKNLKCTKRRLRKDSKKEKGSGKAYDQLLFRHWDEWEDGLQSHVFTQKLDRHGMAKGEPVDVSASVNADVPAVPFGGTSDIAFTADGKQILFATRVASKKEAWSTNYDIYLAKVDKAGAVKNLTVGNKAYDGVPTVSPDGKWLAYLAMQRPGYEADRKRVVLYNLSNGQQRVLAESWDRSVEALTFTADSQSLILRARDTGQRPLWRLDIASNKPPVRLTQDGYANAFTVSQHKIIYAYDNLAAPVDFYAVSAKGGEPKRLTSFNKRLMSRTKTGEYEQFSFAGANNETVYGYVMKPANYNARKKYPIAFIVHGGPQGSFSNHFGYRWNPQFYAGQGYAVVFIDFHGSVGYGQDFTDSINGDWGGKPFVDLQKGLAAATQKYKWLNGKNACALGASYGGYSMNWIAGNWPDRFKCLVSHAGIFDNRSMYYSTEELWFVEWDHRGAYYKNPTSHEKHNPVNHVDKWKTPMLVVQGGKDYRVPDTQSMGTFTALQRRGIPSRFLYFPDENHWISKPLNSKQWHEEVAAWLKQYLQ